jgi:dephospho-CoA kinase
MKVIGITGGIGSGKTTVCKLFELLGVPVFYADDEAKKLYNDARIKARVVKLFGKKILEKGAKIDKKKLAEIMFSDKALLNKLNAIIHPEVGKQFIAWKGKQKGHKMVIREAAIMIESGTRSDIDYLISVISPKDLKISRVLKYRNLSIQDIESRMKEQISDEERQKHSDAIILNDETHSLIEQVMKLKRKLDAK